MPQLSGKVTLVTGAARGIGAAIARAFVTEGATVYVTDIDDDLGAALAAALGPGAHYRRLDVREEADWVRVTREIQSLAILVNNAGITGVEGGTEPHDPENAS